MSGTTMSGLPRTSVPGWTAPLVLFLLLLIVTVGVDLNGLLTWAFGAAGEHTNTLIHEFFHDGRHLLGFPCH